MCSYPEGKITPCCSPEDKLRQLFSLTLPQLEEIAEPGWPLERGAIELREREKAGVPVFTGSLVTFVRYAHPAVPSATGKAKPIGHHLVTYAPESDGGLHAVKQFVFEESQILHDAGDVRFTFRYRGGEQLDAIDQIWRALGD